MSRPTTTRHAAPLTRPQWQADGDGIYDVQYPDSKEVNDRGKILAKDDGTVSYRGILPTAYPIVRIQTPVRLQASLTARAIRPAQRWPRRRPPPRAR